MSGDAGMKNDAGEVVDLFYPRKCHMTNTVIAAADHAAVQIEVASVRFLSSPSLSLTHIFSRHLSWFLIFCPPASLNDRLSLE